ncbi:P-loop containing nucleoside triphosphate hydrolase protein, partial [Violaceomyces palustris]
FSAVHGPEDDQEVFFQTSILPLLADLLMGRNLTLFCYGVTGSGKTWTMVGVASEGEGVTPRLSRSKKGQEEDERKAKEFIKVEMECYEIYNEMVFDLLVQGRNGTGLPVRESGDRKVFVAGLTCKDVGDYREFVSLFGKANANRSTGSTNLNACSSRSHMVISLIVTARFEEGGGESVKVCTSRVNLVDLAGSENNKLTGNNKERLTESSAINKSLFVLGQVVQALNAGAPRIPYRDSKMTMIMRDALGGGGGSGPSSSTSSSRSHGVLIANLAPGSKFYNDSVATLNFASRTKTIENRVGSN